MTDLENFTGTGCCLYARIQITNGMVLCPQKSGIAFHRMAMPPKFPRHPCTFNSN